MPECSSASRATDKARERAWQSVAILHAFSQQLDVQTLLDGIDFF
jgi:hypothetical protein